MGLSCVDALLAEPQALEKDRDAERGNEKGADNRRPGANLARSGRERIAGAIRHRGQRSSRQSSHAHTFQKSLHLK